MGGLLGGQADTEQARRGNAEARRPAQPGVGLGDALPGWMHLEEMHQRAGVPNPGRAPGVGNTRGKGERRLGLFGRTGSKATRAGRACEKPVAGLTVSEQVGGTGLGEERRPGGSREARVSD